MYNKGAKYFDIDLLFVSIDEINNNKPKKYLKI